MTRCPSSEELERLLADRLAGAEAAVEAHVEACPDCQQRLERLAVRADGRPAVTAPASGAAFLGRLEREPPTGACPGPDTERGAAPLSPAPTGEAVAAAPGAAPAIAGYEVLEELGRGGMGVVYKARQLKANRLVALKMILSRAHASLEHKVRFRIEVEAVARFQHPHLVQLYEVGEHDGLPFFSLELCEGGALDRKLKQTSFTAAEAACLVEKLARAMHYAHSRGVVHRDLKPANVLLTADGEPKVTDFGLAKQLDAASDLSQTGAIMGTPSYMAPEQAGGARDIGPATDVYALGAILYELLAGQPPFGGASVLDTLEQVKTREPVPPSRLRPKVPRDLETICLKCLHKEPARRYADAAALAEDLRRYRAGEPILARPVGRVERAVKWAKRRPALAALLLVSALSATGLFVGSLYYSANLEKALQTAQKREKEATEERQQAVTNLYHSLVGEARAVRLTRASGFRATSWDRLQQALRLETPDKSLDELRHEAVACLGDFVGLEPTTWSDFRGDVTTAAIHPDSLQVAVGLRDGTVLVRRRDTGAELARLENHPAPVRSRFKSQAGLLYQL
jgi:tRNA A-37 threonylcarbamoyl transferase component Bud32